MSDKEGITLTEALSSQGPAGIYAPPPISPDLSSLQYRIEQYLQHTEPILKSSAKLAEQLRKAAATADSSASGSDASLLHHVASSSSAMLEGYGASRRRPPEVSAEEVNAAFSALSRDELTVLTEEFDAVNNSFEFLSDNDTEAVIQPPAHQQPSLVLGGDSSDPSFCRDSSHAGASPDAATAGGGGLVDNAPACVVEVEFTSYPWMQEEQVQELGHPRNQFADADDGNDDDDVQSFGQFSRMLHKQQYNNTKHPADNAETQHTNGTSEASNGVALHAHGPASLEANGASTTVVEKPTLYAKRKEKQRTAFIRGRVKEVLLANKVRTATEEYVRSVATAEAERRFASIAASCGANLERLQVLVRESDVISRSLHSLERHTLGDRVEDPSLYLCVPRYQSKCSNIGCAARFSTTVMRVMCRRCGQYYCPPCAVEMGIGPSVDGGDGVKESLGWEPICSLCWDVCASHQRRVAAEMQRERMLSVPPVPSAAATNTSTSSAAPNAAQRSALNSASQYISVKEAVLFGEYCSETRRLEDGLAPYYVKGKDGSHTDFWEALAYRYASVKGRLWCGLQVAAVYGNIALQSASRTVVATANSGKSRLIAWRHNDAPSK